MSSENLIIISLPSTVTLLKKDAVKFLLTWPVLTRRCKGRLVEVFFLFILSFIVNISLLMRLKPPLSLNVRLMKKKRKYIVPTLCALFNALAGMIVFLLTAKIIFAQSGLYVDRVNINSIASLSSGLATVIAITFLESRFYKVSFLSILLSSFLAAIFYSIVLAFLVAFIVGRIG